MKRTQIYIVIAAAFVVIAGSSCAKLTPKIYTQVPNADYWQTADQIAAGVAPAYTALVNLPDGDCFELNGVSSGEILIPIRGADWLDDDIHVQEWQHTWTDTHGNVSGAWTNLFSVIGEANFTLSVVNTLATPPSNLASINAELKTLRDYAYFMAIDMYGSVPYVTNYNENPDAVKATPRAALYDSLVQDLKANIPLLDPNVNDTTYGRVNKYVGYMILAKLYLNAQVYTGTPDWADAVAACDSIISSGLYTLEADYFDNFNATNSTLTSSGNENIFVVPFDNVNIGGNGWETQTLHYQNTYNFGLSGGLNNGFCSADNVYSLFDTTSTYTAKGNTIYRSFLDQRTGQYLVGQQYQILYSYPPSQNVVYQADPSLDIIDQQTNLPLDFYSSVTSLSDASGGFRSAGVRNVKYFWENGTSGNQSNDMVIFRYADVLLMKAEAELRSGTPGDALAMVNQVRTRAYSGDASHNFGSITLDSILNERQRELAWEGWRRNDEIRYEIASGTPYFTAARVPAKTQDPDNHTMLYPIPSVQLLSNPNLTQNPGY
jgi:starch-binding outer membrane protein, SusD/RagB family